MKTSVRGGGGGRGGGQAMLTLFACGIDDESVAGPLQGWLFPALLGKSKIKSSLCRHAYHCMDSKDPDIHVLHQDG